MRSVQRELRRAALHARHGLRQKKERPEAATSKRSRSRVDSENHCIDSLPNRPENVNTLRGEVMA